jgi:hypothetical protein
MQASGNDFSTIDESTDLFLNSLSGRGLKSSD